MRTGRARAAGPCHPRRRALPSAALCSPARPPARVQHARPADVVTGTALGVALQVALAAPFLATYPASYLTRAFEFTRVRLGRRPVRRARVPCVGEGA